MPCQLTRYGLAYNDFMWPLVAVETLLLWVKAGFFGLAVDGLGTFIYMTSEIVKGMRFFVLLLIILWTMFAVAFMNLFPVSYVYGNDPFTSPPPETPLAPSAPGDSLTPVDNRGEVDPESDELWMYFNNFGKALMSAYMTTYNPLDPALALPTRHPEVAIILICLFDFVVVLLFTNTLTTLMLEVYGHIWTAIPPNHPMPHRQVAIILICLFDLVIVLLIAPMAEVAIILICLFDFVVVLLFTNMLNTLMLEVAIILICLFDFVVVLLFTNMLITLMAEVYGRIREKQNYVFLENRADLVIEVESTMNVDDICVPPFLHLLTPIHSKDTSEGGGGSMTEAQKMSTIVADAFRKLDLSKSTNPVISGVDNPDYGGVDDSLAEQVSSLTAATAATATASSGMRSGISRAASRAPSRQPSQADSLREPGLDPSYHNLLLPTPVTSDAALIRPSGAMRLQPSATLSRSKAGRSFKSQGPAQSRSRGSSSHSRFHEPAARRSGTSADVRPGHLQFSERTTPSTPSALRSLGQGKEPSTPGAKKGAKFALPPLLSIDSSGDASPVGSEQPGRASPREDASPVGLEQPGRASPRGDASPLFSEQPGKASPAAAEGDTSGGDRPSSGSGSKEGDSKGGSGKGREVSEVGLGRLLRSVVDPDGSESQPVKQPPELPGTPSRISDG
eukprot:gene21485-28461_t